MTDLITVSIACANAAQAEQIATHLVAQKLAACVQGAPVRSTYIWQGAAETADEVMLTVKTLREKLDAVEAVVKALHSYQVPEILAIRIEWASADYEHWLRSVLKP